MSTTNQPLRDDHSDRNALHVVLFGLPNAGKSSLLGALAQAAELQERQLGGRLFDVTSGLAKLRSSVYHNQPRETTEEIVPYPVRYEPLKGHKPDPLQRLDFILYDCDGRAANDILTHSPAFQDARAQQLVRSLLRADALLMLIDASATEEQREQDFVEFERFLTHLKHHRTRQAEVSGLPVFLVLSKCDLLRRTNDLPSDWSNRIQERCRDVAERFETLLRRHQTGTSGFGTLRLEVTGTAVRRPAFSESEASREPFGVAELFDRVFSEAKDYRERKKRASRRSSLTLVGVAFFLLALTGAAIGLYWSRSQPRPIALASVVENYRSRESPTPSGRLTEPLQRRISELRDIQTHPDFPRLPEEQRIFVDQRLAELNAYQEYKSRLEAERPPADLVALSDLDALEKRLRDSLLPPAAFAAEWSQTEAELLRQKWLDDIRLIRETTVKVIDHYLRQIDEAQRLLRLESPTGGTLTWDEWRENVDSLFRKSSQPFARDTEPLPGSRSLPSLRAPAVTFASIFAQSSVARSRGEWETAHIRLQRMLEVATALGLHSSAGDSAVLRFDANFSFDQVGKKVQTLRQDFPKHAEWTVDEFNPSARPDLESVAHRSYQRLIEATRQRIALEFRKLTSGGKESRDAWLAVARWLVENAELNEARLLFRVLQRLAGIPVEDLSATLSAFLQLPNIPLQIRSIQVVVPDNAYLSRLRPMGDLVITQIPPESEARAFRFRREEQALRENREGRTTYTFSASSGSETIVFVPGAVFYAELDMRDEADQSWRLSWLQCRSTMYRYESLFGQPRFYKPEVANPLDGQRLDIRLRCRPEGGVPAVPVLLPDVNR